MSETTVDGWVILELMGDRRLAGRVDEVTIAGSAFLHLIVPASLEPGDETIKAEQFYAPSAVYCITPVTEGMARAVALRHEPRPLNRWELPPLLRDTQVLNDVIDDDEFES